MQLSAEQFSLSNLLDEANEIRIPEYQRNYAWDASNIDQYLDDLSEAIQSQDDHFFGPIVLLDEGQSVYSVIDGQQRLTTTIMLLSLIRDKLTEMGDPTFDVGGASVPLKHEVNQMLRDKNFIGYRFTANRQIAPVFESYIMQEPGPLRKELARNGKGLTDKEKENTKALRSAYFRLKAGLDGLVGDAPETDSETAGHLFSLITTLKKSLKLLRISVPDEEDAYVLFETLNDRGVRLTAPDLLKSYTLRSAKGLGEVEVEDVVATWDEANELLGDFSFEKFLRHFLLSVQNETAVQAKKIFPMFRERIEKIGPITNLEEIAGAAFRYAQLLNDAIETGDPELDATLDRINLFSDTHRVFLLSVFEGKSEDPDVEGWSEEVLRYAARATEMVAFRWTLRGGNAQVLENIYQRYANRVRSEATPTLSTQALTAILEGLMAEAPSDDEVRLEINSSGVKSNHLTYVLTRLEGALSGDLLRWVRHKVTPQALAPISPSENSNWYDAVAPAKGKAGGDEKTYEDYVQMWGNYTLLEFPLDNSLKHSNWSTRVSGNEEAKGLNKSDMYLNKDLVVLGQLTREDIVGRTEWMADSIVLLSSAKAAGTAVPPIIEGFRA